MAKCAYIGVDGVARKIKQPYIGVDNVARKVTKAYIGVDNVARQYLSGGTPISELSVGDSVYMNVNGVSKEFLVIHQGNPDSSIYDSSCDGTWLLLKGVYTTMAFGDSIYYYESNIHSYLNNDFINLLDENIKNTIKQVKIPYTKRNLETYAYETFNGSNGLLTKVFLLSREEIGRVFSSYTPIEGVPLSYFENKSAADISIGAAWWLRSIYTQFSGGNIYYIASNGRDVNSGSPSFPYGVRPALILPSDTLMDSNFNVIG
jgi:hypothetical protein